MEGAREVLDIQKAGLVGYLGDGKMALLKELACVIDAHFDDRLFGGDMKNRLVKVAEATLAKEAKRRRVGDGYRGVGEIAVQVIDARGNRTVLRIFGIFAAHVVYQIKNGEKNGIRVHGVAARLAEPGKREISKERDEDMGVDGEGLFRDLAARFERNVNHLFTIGGVCIGYSFWYKKQS